MQTTTIVMGNDIGELGPFGERVTALLEEQSIPPETVYAVNLAIEEMASNVIKYGYDDRAPHQITVLVTPTRSEVTVVLEDDGRPFDPLSRQGPDLTKPIDERPIGGLGIFLVRKTCSEMRYERVGERNLLTMSFRCGGGHPEQTHAAGA